jgi:hypothetical protein
MLILKLIFAISFVSEIIAGSQNEHLTTKAHFKTEMTPTKSTVNPNEQKSGLTTKAGFNVDKLVAQAKELESKKNKIWRKMNGSNYLN